MDRHKFMKDVFGDNWSGDIPDSTIIDSALKTLTEREQQVLKLRYSGMSYQQVSDLVQHHNNPNQYITRERVRQIINKALRKLRHPSRARKLKGRTQLKARAKKTYGNLRSSDISLSEFEFSVRVANCLRNAEISTLGELASKTDRELLKIKHFGRKSFDEVMQFLDEEAERRRQPTIIHKMINFFTEKDKTERKQLEVKIDQSLWRELKILALKQDKTATELLEASMKEYLAKHGGLKK